MTTTYQNEYQSSIRRAKAEKANLSLKNHLIKASSRGYELYRKDMRGGMLGEFLSVADAVKAANV